MQSHMFDLMKQKGWSVLSLCEVTQTPEDQWTAVAAFYER